MSAITSAPGQPGVLQMVEMGLAAIDEMSTVRHLHAASVRRVAAGMLSEAEVRAFAEHIYTEAYSSRMADVVIAGRLTAARISGELAGTAGWLAANDTGAVARLVGVFVSPLYARHGLGRALVAAAEAQARQAGYPTFTIRAPLGASSFFQRLGYQVASHGVWPMTRDVALPVAFLRKSDPGAVPIPLRPRQG